MVGSAETWPDSCNVLNEDKSGPIKVIFSWLGAKITWLLGFLPLISLPANIQMDDRGWDVL